MGLFTDLPYRQIFKVCRRLWPGESTPHLSSLYQARQRLGVVLSAVACCPRARAISSSWGWYEVLLAEVGRHRIDPHGFLCCVKWYWG